MIYCVWYPSGGFGHYINAIVRHFVLELSSPTIKDFSFSDIGDSHTVPYGAPKYFHDPDYYQWCFSDDVDHTVMIDNGINSESTKFVTMFPGCQIIKLVYSDYSWPIIAQTTIVKAMHVPLQTQIAPDTAKWSQPTADWSVREKFFLYLRDHYLRPRWRPDNICINIDVADVYHYDILCQYLSVITQDVADFADVHSKWQQVNLQYYEPIFTANNIIESLDQNTNLNLSNVTDLWTQAVVNYYIWLKYRVEVPANAYADWFNNTSEIYELLSNYKSS